MDRLPFKGLGLRWDKMYVLTAKLYPSQTKVLQTKSPSLQEGGGRVAGIGAHMVNDVSWAPGKASAPVSREWQQLQERMCTQDTVSLCPGRGMFWDYKLWLAPAVQLASVICSSHCMVGRWPLEINDDSRKICISWNDQEKLVITLALETIFHPCTFLQTSF